MLTEKIAEWGLKGWVATLITGFGVFCVSQGHNGVIIGSVFTLLGLIIGVNIPSILEKLK